MTEPHYDGDDELNRLYRALARSRANTQQLEEMIAEREGASFEEVVRRRRRGFRIVPGLAAAVAGGDAVRRWAARNTDRLVAFGAGSAIAAVSAIAITGTGEDPPAAIHVAPTPAPAPPEALPPIGHRNPPRIGPPKSGPPAPPGPGRADPIVALPRLPSTVLVPRRVPVPSAVPTTVPTPGPPVPPVVPPPPARSTDDCRIYLPRLLPHRPLLCGAWPQR